MTLAGGCEDVPPPPSSAGDGTYYSTNETGTWTPVASRRITTIVGAASLALDVAYGRVHVLVGTGGAGRRSGHDGKIVAGPQTATHMLNAQRS